ncbi:MAG: hypothetical protein OXG15_12100 [Gammaproteobacteria bacterium]|nr:hypothetical protein [Gammaproteobacteria bacterium]
MSEILTVSCLAHVCAGVSIERAFDQADVVIEAKLNPKTPREELKNPTAGEGEMLYLPTGLTFDVLNVWKGDETATALIYIYAVYTGFDDDQTYLIFATRNFDIQTRERKHQIDEVPPTNLRLFTSGCIGNKILREDRASQLAREKLDRISEEHIGSEAQSEHAVALQMRIREIVKSSKDEMPTPE